MNGQKIQDIWTLLRAFVAYALEEWKLIPLVTDTMKQILDRAINSGQPNMEQCGGRPILV